jgi:hypothetical protein
MRAVLVATLCFGAALRAQAVKDYDFHLDNGAEVLYQTYGQAGSKDPPLNSSPSNLGTARAFGNTIERNILDGQNIKQLGFDLQIEKLAGDPIRFRVSMGGPVGDSQGGFWGFFGRTAPPREIQNGDRVLLDVLEEPATGRKVFDTFQVGIGVGMHAMPVAKTIPKIPAAGTTVHLQSPCTLDGALPGRSTGNVSGEVVGVSIPGKGVLALSATPGSGYRMEGIAEGNVLMFVTGNERYDIQCAAPVVDGAGAWYLWVRREPAEMLKKPLEFTTR